MKDLLQLLQREGAEELLLVSGSSPAITARGKPRPVDVPVLTSDELDTLLDSISTEGQRAELQRCGDLRFIYIQNAVRFVVMAKHQSGKLKIIITNLYC